MEDERSDSFYLGADTGSFCYAFLMIALLSAKKNPLINSFIQFAFLFYHMDGLFSSYEAQAVSRL